MDVLGKLVWAVLIIWAVAMASGLLIALAPVILSLVGFILMVALVAFVGRLVASFWFY